MRHWRNEIVRISIVLHYKNFLTLYLCTTYSIILTIHSTKDHVIRTFFLYKYSTRVNLGILVFKMRLIMTNLSMVYNVHKFEHRYIMQHVLKYHHDEDEKNKNKMKNKNNRRLA